jgi:DNA-binding transcriptional LysR family regulator
MKRGFAALGMPLPREQFALRTDDQVAYGQLVAAGAGIGFVARTTWRTGRAWCRAAADAEDPAAALLAGGAPRDPRQPLVRRVYDFLAEARRLGIPHTALAEARVMRANSGMLKMPIATMEVTSPGP